MEANRDKLTGILGTVAWSLLGFLALFFLVELAFSMAWRMQHDTPLLHYAAFLIDKHDFAPYKDVFETSMVGTFLFHLGVGKVFGYSDLAFRIVDLLFLSLLLGGSWLVMRPLGRLVALTGPLLFGIYYLMLGPSMGLQRDCLGILPIAISLLLARPDFRPGKTLYKAALIGVLFGLSASFKPHLALGLPAVLIYMHLNAREAADRQDDRTTSFRQAVFFFGSAAVGFLVVLSLLFLWLWQTGGLPYFWEIFSSYLPLHLNLTREHQIVDGVERLYYLFDSFRRLGGWQGLLIPVALGSYIAFSSKEKSRHFRFIVLLLVMLLLYSLYPVLSGQFWNYHWMPFVYFGSLCASLVLLPVPARAVSAWSRIVPTVTFAVFLLISVFPSARFTSQLAGESRPPKKGRVDAIAEYLKKNLRPGDTVQPLDWTGGAIHAMLIAEAVVATRYVYDYYFYHHISHAYIQQLRQRFLEDLAEAKPRFVIHVEKTPRPNGKDTTSEFPELKNYVVENYTVVLGGDGFTILERMPAQ